MFWIHQQRVSCETLGPPPSTLPNLSNTCKGKKKKVLSALQFYKDHAINHVSHPGTGEFKMEKNSKYAMLWMYRPPDTCMVHQLHLTLLQPHNPPGSSVHEIFQSRILQQLAISYSRESSWPRKQIRFSCISCVSKQILYHCTSREAQLRHLSKDKFQWTCILSSSQAMENIKIINLKCLFLGLSNNLFMLDNISPPQICIYLFLFNT